MRRLSLGPNIAFSLWQSQQSRILNENSPISSSIRLNSHLIGSQYISPHSSAFHESQLVLACASWQCFSWLFHQLRLKVSAKGVEKSRDVGRDAEGGGENNTMLRTTWGNYLPRHFCGKSGKLDRFSRLSVFISPPISLHLSLHFEFRLNAARKIPGEDFFFRNQNK